MPLTDTLSVASLSFSATETGDHTDIITSEDHLLPDSVNAIHNLVKNVNYKRKSTTTGLLSLNSTSTVVSLNGPTARDIPQTKLTPLDTVDNDVFDGYSSRIAEDYDYFISNKSLTTQSLKTLSGNEALLDINSLSHVPEFYFHDDFRLDDPRIFNKVTGNAQFLSLIEPQNGKRVLDHEELQDKLSSYMDIVEIHLVHEISNSSDDFFSALDDLKQIVNSSKQLNSNLDEMQHLLEQAQESKIERGEKIIHMLQKYQNIGKFNQVVLQIKAILKQSDIAEENYYMGDYDKCLYVIDSVFAMIRGNVPPHPLITNLTQDWKYPLRDLNKLPALIPLKRQLSNLVSDTGKSYAKLFANYLLDDLRSTYDTIDREDVLQRLLGNKKVDNYNIVSDEFKSTILIYLKGLARCGELSSAFKLYEERFSNELKNIFKENLPSDSHNVNENQSTDSRSISATTTAHMNSTLILADLLKNMTPKEFENLLVSDFTQFSESFRRLTVHKNILLTTAIDVLNNVDPQILKAQPDIIMDLDITNAISSVINSIQRRISKVIKIREQQNAFLSLNYFLRFHRLTTSFLTECEIVSKGMVNEPILKDIIQRQLFLFIQQFHKSNLKNCIDLIEAEVWKDDGLPLESQKTIELINSASEGNFDMSEWVRGLNIDFDQPQQSYTHNVTEKRKTLNLHGQHYILPTSVASILNIIKAYLFLIYYFRMNMAVVSQSYLPELLKAINLKIHQSVLGAQATKTAGLKHVTTKHLALAGEVCRFWSYLVSDIERACLSELDLSESSRQSLMKEYDEVKALFGDQVSDIYDKLVAIMKDTTQAIIAPVAATGDSFVCDGLNPYMESIVKKTLTIARSVQRYLPTHEYDGVMLRIFNVYEKILIDKYSEILDNSSDKTAVRNQIRKDIMFFKEKLDDVDNGRLVSRVLQECGCITDETELPGDSKIERPPNSQETPDPEHTSEIETKDSTGGESTQEVKSSGSKSGRSTPNGESGDTSVKSGETSTLNGGDLVVPEAKNNILSDQETNVQDASQAPIKPKTSNAGQASAI